MTTASRSTSFFILLLATVALVALLKIVGPLLFTNNWSFTQWHYLPTWLPVIISVIAIGGILLSWKNASVFESLFENRWAPLIIGIAVIAIAVLYRFDSFLYGGGNLEVARISQADVIIKRPYDFGIITIVSWLFAALKTSLKPDAAAAWAWRSISWLSGILVLYWGWKLSAYLSTKHTVRTCIMLAIFFAPSAAMLFGFIAPEPVLVAVTVGTAYGIFAYTATRSGKALLGMWVTVLIGALFYLPCAYLLPAVVFTTFTPKPKAQKSLALSVIAALLTAFLLLGGLYWTASKHMELAAQLLFFKGKNPNSDYGMFYSRHIADMLQLLLMAAPQLLIAIYLLITRGINNARNAALLIMSLCGIALMWLIDPVQSIILDAPLYVAYLAPITLLLLSLVSDSEGTLQPSAASPAAVLFVSAFALFSWLPLNRSVTQSQDYVEPYFTQHENFYMTGIFAFRDALFSEGYVGLANGWEAKLLVKSPEYIDLQGCRDLALKDDNSEALRELFKIKINYPYWGDPRYMIAGIQMKIGRPDLARPELDTALMLEPYNKSYLTALYGMHRDKGAFTEAITAIQQTLRYYPNDSLILSDYMIVSYRAGDIPKADSLRKELRNRFPNLPYPFLIEGLIAQSQGNLAQAKRTFERFIAMAPTDPDTPRIRKLLNDIVLRMQADSTGKP